MFGIGVGELFVIFVIAIVVIGPSKLPEVARTIGKVFATVKRTTNSLRDQMQDEVRKFQEMDEVKEFKASIESEMYQVKDATETYLTKEIEAEEKRLEEEAQGIHNSLEQSLSAEGGPMPETVMTGDTGHADTAEELAAHAAPSGAVLYTPNSPAYPSDGTDAATAVAEASAVPGSDVAETATPAAAPEPRGPLTAAEVAAAHGARIYTPPSEVSHGTNGGSNGSTPNPASTEGAASTAAPAKPVA